MIEITYVFHDCFVIEMPEFILVFDFWKDPLRDEEDFPYFIINANKSKTVYVFVSHHHKDHFTKKIFEWERICPKIRYILSKDVARFSRHILSPDSLYKGHKPSMENIIILKSGEKYSDELIKVEAFGSTDIGNSYYLETSDNKAVSIFHAGDLNAWIWKDESTELEVNKALNDFNQILQQISAAHGAIDYVMFPVDSRIGSEYYTGAKLFVEAIDVKHFFPMHFGLGDKEEECLKRRLDAANVKLYANHIRGEYICLQTPYSVYLNIK